jgi:hypothetical protein
MEETKLGHDVGFERRCLARTVETWISNGSVQPTLDWDEIKPRIMLKGGGLFGALAVQLLQAVGYPDALAICDGCGKPFVPTMRPSPNRRSYCKDCGRRAALRDAARRYRDRLKQKLMP